MTTGRKISSGLIVLHMRYQCRRNDYWAEDILGTNSPIHYLIIYVSYRSCTQLLCKLIPEKSHVHYIWYLNWYLRWRTISPEGISRPVVSASALIPHVGRKISSGLIVLHMRYQCRRNDYWAEDILGTNSPPHEVSMPTQWLLDGRYPRD
jgi:hypothetical protein